MSHPLADAVALQLRRGPATSAELQTRFGLSQPVVSRLLAELQRAGLAIAFGKARAARYAAPREIAGESTFPITRVDEDGVAQAYGTLRCVAPSSYLFSDSEGRFELFDGLPWFLADMRPQGFLGRAFPKLHADLDLPQRVIDWTDDHTLTALALRGEDAVGDLIVGNESLRRFMERPTAEVPSRGIALHYERYAQQALTGTPAGSSAGGEQPKFALTIRSATARRHVLVKFSDQGHSPAQQRGRDLLICESLALDVLAASGLGLVVPAHRLLSGQHRLFLEIERFDRTASGRRGVASLLAIDSHFVARMTTWSESAVRLRDQRLISGDDARRIADLEAFGRLIGNTDMHYGNLSLFRQDPPAMAFFALAPVYDQLPMLYAPVAGEIVQRKLGETFLAPSAEALPNFGRVVELASNFWSRVADHPKVSAQFRTVADTNRGIVARTNFGKMVQRQRNSASSAR
jgi:hypothetical protein